MPIDEDRLLEQSQSLKGPLSCYWKEDRNRTQIEIVGREIGGRTADRMGGLRSLQGRLNDPGDTGRHLFLEVEHVLQRAVETVGPEMCAGFSVDQLRGYPETTAGFAHRTFEHIAHAELAPDLLHIDRLALVRETRIPGDDEKP